MSLSGTVSRNIQLLHKTNCSVRQSKEPAVKIGHNTRPFPRYGNVWYRSSSTNWNSGKRTILPTMVRRWWISGKKSWRTCATYRKRDKTRKTLRIQSETLKLLAYWQEASLSKSRKIFLEKAINFTHKSRVLGYGIGTEKFCKFTLKKNQTNTTKSWLKCFN